jgi:hypothetical protein
MYFHLRASGAFSVQLVLSVGPGYYPFFTTKRFHLLLQTLK